MRGSTSPGKSQCRFPQSRSIRRDDRRQGGGGQIGQASQSSLAVNLRSYGAQGRNRTTDTAIFSRMLYQLSYLGVINLCKGCNRRGYRKVAGGCPALYAGFTRRPLRRESRHAASTSAWLRRCGAVAYSEHERRSDHSRSGSSRPQMPDAGSSHAPCLGNSCGSGLGSMFSAPIRWPRSTSRIFFARPAIRFFPARTRPVSGGSAS